MLSQRIIQMLLAMAHNPEEDLQEAEEEEAQRRQRCAAQQAQRDGSGAAAEPAGLASRALGRRAWSWRGGNSHRRAGARWV